MNNISRKHLFIMIAFFCMCSIFTNAQTTQQASKPDRILHTTNKDTSEPVLYLYVDQPPQFKGGPKALKDYISKHLHCPTADMCIELTVHTSFIIEKDGTISDIRIIKRTRMPAFDFEAEKMLEQMPQWNPGKIDDKPVRTLLYLPIAFIIQQ